MPATKKLTIAALLAVTVSVAGCNSKKASSTDSGSPATTASAAPAASAANAGASAPAATGAGAAASGGCALTAAQVTVVMGATYGAPQNTNGFCFYASSTDSLTIHVEDVSALHDFDAELASAKESQQTDKTPTTIPGLGDKAAGIGQQLVVAAGGKTIDIRDADTGGTAWPKSIALAKLVIADLH
jgi:hypothetical protein